MATPTHPCLHRRPPATASSFYRARPGLLVGLGLGFTLLALAAAIHGAWLPLRWDLPIQRFVEGHRTDALDTVFRTISRFGSTPAVVVLSAFLTLLTWGKCRAVSIAIVTAALARPLTEFTLKAIVGRDRPHLARLVAGNGPSFPSGHVLAAVALYGVLPFVVALFTRNRALWWASVACAGLMTVAIAASRVYLGVHWVSDVVASLLLGSFFLLGIEAVVGRVHAVNGCGIAGSCYPVTVNVVTMPCAMCDSCSPLSSSSTTAHKIV